MKQGKGALFSLGIILVGILFSLITYIGLTLLGVVDLSSKETLTFYVNDVSKEYDGEALKANDYRMEGNLPDGYKLYVDYLGELTTIGEQKSSIDVKVYNEENAEVTNQFEIVVFQGKIEVTTRKIDIVVKNSEYHVSDGKVLIDLEEKVNKSGDIKLLPGHSIEAKLPSDFNISTDGIDNLVVSPKIINENGRDVSHYYDISFTMPSILERGSTPIKVGLKNLEKEYDGLPFVPGVVLLSGEIEKGHEIVAVPLTNEIEVGEYQRFEVSFVVKNHDGEDVTGMYSITAESYYSVEILPREITLEPYETAKYYDGSIFDETEAVVVSGSLVEGDSATIKFDTPLETIGNTTTNLSASIQDKNGEDVTDQYEINFKRNQVGIALEKATIQIGGVISKKAFDGEPFGELEENEDYVIKNGKVLSGHTMVVKFKDDFSIIGEGTSELLVEIKDGDGNDVTDLYDISHEESYHLEIVGIEVKINIGSGFSKIYDGKPFKEDQGYLDVMDAISVALSSDYPGLGNVRLKEEYESLIDVTEGPIALTGYMFEADGFAGSGYSFKVEGTPTIEIEQKQASLELADDIDEIARTFNGQPIEITASMITSKDFEENHEIIYVNSTKFDLDAYLSSGDEGEISVLSVSVYDKVKNKDVTHNYKINFDKVRNVPTYFEPIEIGVKAKDITLEVDFDVDQDTLEAYINTYFDPDSLFEITGGNKLYEGHIARYEGEYSVASYGDVYVIQLGDSRGFDIYYGHSTLGIISVGDIYDITFKPGVLTVKNKQKENISIILPSLTFEYDGITTAEELALNALQQMTLPHDMYYNGSYVAGLDYVEPDTYTYTIDSYDIYGYDENLHNLTIIPGTITILAKANKENISIILPSATFEYDGMKTVEDLINQQLAGITLPSGLSILDYDCSDRYEVGPGTYTYTVSVNDIDGYDEDKHNLSITPGTITILASQEAKKNVNVVLPTLTKEYDGNSFEAVVNSYLLSMNLPDGIQVSLNTSLSSDVHTHILTESDIFVDFGVNDSDDYLLSITPGVLTINKKTLTVYGPNVNATETSDITLEIENSIESMLTSAGISTFEVSYEVDPSVDLLTAGTYLLKDYVSFSCDTDLYKLVISSMGTLTITA